MDLLKGGQWGIVAADDGYLLMGKDMGFSSLPDRFFDFARARDPEIQYPLDATFGPLHLLGFDVEPRGALHGKDPYATFTLYWRTVEPTKKDYQVAVFLISPSNTVIANLTQHAATTWYPTSQWRPDETIKVVVPKVPMAGYRLGEVHLGVIDGKDENSLLQRVSPKLADTSNFTRLNGDQTLLKLKTLTVE